MQLLELFNFSFKLAHLSLMETLHLLHFQIEGLYLLILIFNLLFQVPLFIDKLLHIEVSLLQLLVVGNMSERGLRSLAFVVLLVESNLVSHKLHISLMNDLKLIDSIFVVSP